MHSKLAMRLLEEEDSKYVESISEAFKEENQAFHWLADITEITLPLEKSDTQIYSFKTTATNGGIMTPWFGQDFDEEKLRKKVEYKYEINLPSNLNQTAEGKDLVIELRVDTKENIGGFEELVFTPPGRDNEAQIFKQTGPKNINMTFKIDSTFTGRFRKMSFLFTRSLTDSHLQFWIMK